MGKWGKNMQNWKNGQKSLFEVRFWFLRWLFGGFGGYFVLKSGLRILIRVPQVPFSVPSKWQKQQLDHFFYFAYFWVIFPLARTIFFKCKIRAEGTLKSKSCQHKLALELNFLSNSKGLGLYFNFWFFTEPYYPLLTHCPLTHHPHRPTIPT